MSSASFDPGAVLNRILEYAAQNLRVEKVLIQIGLDPTNITYEAMFNRLLDIVLANINFANMLALIGAVFYVVDTDGAHDRAVAGRWHHQHAVLYRLWRLGRSGRDLFPVSTVASDQHYPPSPDAQSGQEGRVSAQGDLSLDWLNPS